MRPTAVVILTVVFLLLAAQADALVSLYFDSQGNLRSSPPAKTMGPLTARAAGSSVPSGIDLRRNISYEFFPVSGKTFSEVVESAEGNGPARKGSNKRYPSRLDWSFSLSFDFDYTYDLNEEDGTVHVALDVHDVKVAYDLAITLPTLIDSTPLNPVEQDLWKAYLRSLLDSEYGKVDVITDPEVSDRAEESLREITYIIFDYTDDTAIQRTVTGFLREEAARAGKETAQTIREKLAGNRNTKD
ncbi:MAG: DUF922 domain-containing protein [Nitrospiraceae bacterium]|nr:DUF922 domain-containing protein [Nitrospiraceae bacterium]